MKHQNTQYFYFDGVDSRDYGIYLSSAIKLGGAQPSIETLSIPGRSGALLRYDSSFSNVAFSAQCFVQGERTAQDVAAIAQWLLGTQGYRRLEFPWEDGYRMAYVSESPGIECLSKHVSAFSLDFSCAPQVWTYAGQQAIQIANGDTLHNEWMAAKPLITIYGYGTGSLTVGDTTVSITNGFTGYITLDCETQDAYRGDDNMNAYIDAAEFPTIPHGTTKVSWTVTSGSFYQIEIIPRWWHL